MIALVCRSRKKKRRVVERNEGGWAASTINVYIASGDEVTYKLNFRVSQDTFDHVTKVLKESRYVMDNTARNPAYQQTAAFKIGVCMYFLAHGKGDAKVVGDAAGIGSTTVKLYLSQFIKGVLAVLRPLYMPGTPPAPENVELIRQQFASRRGIGNVAMAVDGTHIPFSGGAEYRNYKGSILAVAFVNSYYLFVGADVGHVGSAGDNAILKECSLLRRIRPTPKRG